MFVNDTYLKTKATIRNRTYLAEKLADKEEREQQEKDLDLHLHLQGKYYCLLFIRRKLD
jgi:hypothetical protein